MSKKDIILFMILMDMAMNICDEVGSDFDGVIEKYGVDPKQLESFVLTHVAHIDASNEDVAKIVFDIIQEIINKQTV